MCRIYECCLLLLINSYYRRSRAIQRSDSRHDPLLLIILYVATPSFPFRVHLRNRRCSTYPTSHYWRTRLALISVVIVFPVPCIDVSHSFLQGNTLLANEESPHTRTYARIHSHRLAFSEESDLVAHTKRSSCPHRQQHPVGNDQRHYERLTRQRGKHRSWLRLPLRPNICRAPNHNNLHAPSRRLLLPRRPAIRPHLTFVLIPCGPKEALMWFGTARAP